MVALRVDALASALPIPFSVFCTTSLGIASMKTELSPFGLRGRTVFFVLFLFFSFLAYKSAYAQLNLNLVLTPELQNAQILRLSDFNITGSGSVSRLFDLTITNRSSVPVNASLRFEFLSDRFPNTPVVVAVSQFFPVPPTPQSLNLTYPDITRNGNVVYDAEALDELTNVILKTSRLPTGTYTFNLAIFAEGQPNVPQASQQQTLTISNPTALDLISPGAPVGGSECYAQFGLLPQFKWDSNADRFLITVCEALPTNSSPEEVMQNEPRLQQLVQRGSDFFGSPSLLYPSGGLPLEYGKTYYWQVQAMIDAPSGEVRLPSEIWCFQISAIGDPGVEIMLQQLLSLLNSSDFEALFREGGPLHGFKPTGAAALNGQRMNLTELISLLRSRSIRVVSTQVEP
jgi:hypothetical protein